MKRILVPTDFSKEAEFATIVAAQFAKKFNCEVHFLNMIELPLAQIDQINNTNSPLPEALYFMKLAKKRFEELLEKPYMDDVDAYYSIKMDPIFDGIHQATKDLDIDMIIMGSHGATGFSEIFIGSNTEKVVRRSHIPVLIIKSTENTFKANNIVFASNFNPDNLHTFKEAVAFAKLFDSKIHLLLVNTPNSFIKTSKAKERINHYLTNTDFTNYTINIYSDDSIEQGILQFSKDIDADIIGISTHGREGIAHFFNGSISEDIVNHAARPVLTFKI